jgi:hypothetical protein
MEANMKRISILLLILFTCLTAATAWAGSHIVYVHPPNGTDDTTNIQAALDTCVAYGKNCTVQLAAGTYFTRQLVEYNFQGTFKGKGKDITIIQALPYLPVTLDFLQPCQPNSTTCLWPTLMIFVDGNISISDLSVHMYASEGTATAPWPRFGSTSIDTGIRLMGQYSTTNVHIDRVEMEGSPDSTSGFGFNVNNGIMYTGELSGSSANPLDSPCGAAVGLASSLGPFRRFNLAHPKLLIPLARLFLPHPIYKESSKLGECGNREAISKGSGKGGKPDFGFPGFPLPVISTA